MNDHEKAEDSDKTTDQLVEELKQTRRRMAALESSKTELEQTLVGLRKNVERLNLALKSSQTGTWSLDVQEGICTWDDHCPPLFGLPPGSF
jgi:septal ring factor EnvC (AmiA/AmiB activator)